MTLFMIQMRPDMTKLVRWARDHNVLPSAAEGDLGYTLHALLKANFGALSPKPFQLLQRGNTSSLLAYSAVDATALRDQSITFAMPEATAALGLETIESKAMPAVFDMGRQLGFEVRVRPVVRTDRNGDRNKTREVDAFLAAAATQPDSDALSRPAIYAEWLVRHLTEGGCALVAPPRLSSLRRTVLFRRDGNRRLRRIGGVEGGPDATFCGTVSITDPSSFQHVLSHGIGRHRAFGFGMILLRPA